VTGLSLSVLVHSSILLSALRRSFKLKVSRKLTIATPSPELVDAYLTEIAKAYSVNWSAAPLGTTGGDDGADGGAKVGATTTHLCSSPSS